MNSTASGSVWLTQGTSSGTANVWTQAPRWEDYTPGVGERWQPIFIPQAPDPARELAEKKAKELLRDIIGEELAEKLEQGGTVRIGGEYEIDYLGRCWKLFADGSKKQFCIVPKTQEFLPWGDVLVNKIVPLLCDPEGAEKVANWFGS